jgi:MFS family permease
VGLSVGPFCGGFLTQQLGWRSIFLAMFPLGGLSIVVTRAFLKDEWADAASQRLDFTGCLIYGAAILALVYGAASLPAWIGFTLLAAGIAGMILFFRHQRRTAHPVFDVALFFENRTFTFSSLAALLNYSATFAVTFMMSLYLQYIGGMTPKDAGMVLMAQPVIMAVFSPLAGRLSDRIEPRLLATGGMAITAGGMVIFSRLHMDTPVTHIVSNLVLLGFGFALFSSPNMSAIMGSVTKKDYGIASGATATMRLLGQMTSMAIATVVLTLLVGHKAIGPGNYDHFLISVQTLFMVSALLCTIGIFLSMFRGRLRR